METRDDDSSSAVPPLEPQQPPVPLADTGIPAAMAPAPEAEAGATATPQRQDSRSATFSAQSSPGASAGTLWRHKSMSCEGVRSFEAARKAHIDAFQDRDRAYWQAFEREILRAKDENGRLQRFFTLRLQADLAYAESLRKIRQVIEQPVAPQSTSQNAATGPGQLTSPGSNDALSVTSSLGKALNTLGEVQQQISEKLVQFTNVVKRDVVARPLDEMIATFDERTSVMLAEGNKCDALLFEAQKNVVDSFTKYDAVYREMESDKNASTPSSNKSKQDLWLAEVAYGINVQKLQQRRVEYVKGMAGLFQQYKSLEVLRTSVLQTSMDTYLRKQKLMYDEMSGAMAEPMARSQRIEPERDLLLSMRRIPKSYTAAALAAETKDQNLFGKLPSSLSSPLLVRCGFLKHQASGSLFKSWKDVLCAITQDECMHLIDLKDNVNQSITKSTEAILDAIRVNEQNGEVACVSICLANCRLEMLGNNAVPSFELTENNAASGLLGSMFGLETTRKFTFQCPSQSDLIDWVVAAQHFISPVKRKSSSNAARQ